MKTIKNTLLAIGMAFFISSCSYETIRVSEEVSTRDYGFTDITELEVATDFKAYVSFSETEESVSIRANDNLFEKIRIYQEGEKLTVKLKNNINLKGKETLNLFITMKEITHYKASSDASIYLDDPLTADIVRVELSSDAYFEGDITAQDFDLRASSDSQADVFVEANEVYLNLSSSAKMEGELRASSARARLTSDSTVDVVGTLDELDATLTSDGRFGDYGLQIEDLVISLSSDSDAYLTVNNTIDVTANSDSRLFYKGDAEIIRQNLSSDGRVIKK
ncbi:GIN domain-containing protein [Flagellimonas myxillae]|uniref:GIN domain-containing protein n=1 Tax=Flagellimonas myxillae TaxID=2942214 RepID=UPI00201F27B1|nr:DUF2807 domain-containing protein [Muricauda myxillae]MCL6267069.1 DUF2807 domain-containing protein [Muricauda myxillae]